MLLVLFCVVIIVNLLSCEISQRILHFIIISWAWISLYLLSILIFQYLWFSHLINILKSLTFKIILLLNTWIWRMNIDLISFILRCLKCILHLMRPRCLFRCVHKWWLIILEIMIMWFCRKTYWFINEKLLILRSF
jgi:hypothetical protein